MADSTLTLVRRYHDSWTSKDYESAIALLSPELEVEVPINDYPTTESFAAALVRTAGMMSGVELLAEMSSGNEAMLLYDMELQGLGVMRVVEHFTISDGKVVRLRQIHDTAALRAAGTGTVATPTLVASQSLAGSPAGRPEGTETSAPSPPRTRQ